MPDPVPPPARRGSRLHTLLLVVLTLSAAVLAADRVNEAVIRWRYEAFLKERHELVNMDQGRDGDNEAFKKKYNAVHAFWDANAVSFRSRGLRHPNEWR